MPTRRQALALGPGSAVALLAGCSALGADDNSEAASDLRDAYQTAYDHNQTAVSHFDTMFQNIDDRDYVVAYSQSQQAHLRFKDAREAYTRADLLDQQTQVWGGDPPQVHHDASAAVMQGNSDASTAKIWLESAADSGEMGSTAEIPFSSIRSRFNAGEHEIPTPEEFEETL